MTPEKFKVIEEQFKDNSFLGYILNNQDGTKVIEVKGNQENFKEVMLNLEGTCYELNNLV